MASYGSVQRAINDKLQRAEHLEQELKRDPAAGTETADAPEPAESTRDALAAVRLRQHELKLTQRAQDMHMRRRLAKWAIGFVAAQLLFANAFFGYYLWHNLQSIEASVMIAWLSACVIEVIGILWVIARSLFPYRDKSAPNGKRDAGPTA